MQEEQLCLNSPIVRLVEVASAVCREVSLVSPRRVSNPLGSCLYLTCVLQSRLGLEEG